MDDLRSKPAIDRWRSLRELDESLQHPKGSAFRAFRRLENHWQETSDFIVLHHERDRALIDILRQQQRIYASTVNLVMLSPELADAVIAQMRRMTTDPAE
ncbi:MULTISPECIES: hypothetical protein [Hydrocarboniphaga]|uniref:Uncharacterized protein n=1 Tax=Hydrocarboniphaga effusa AP103 TaxID=1172194 RepID=I7ZEY1_9GAMM|nr:MULTISPECIES: hypothetical protein [Hydrocarboniphaga]EIT70272.1 hypothetical protein WQQ_04090 [Hydrocarboniphaga effusa AP103]MDZ4077293.1 hypothetical protein [Hydrocarboniphaga sp.]